MQLIILKQLGRSIAYDADVMAGLGDFDSVDTLLASSRSNRSLIEDLAQHCSPVDLSDETEQYDLNAFESRMRERGHIICELPKALPSLDFNQAFLSGCGAALLELVQRKALRDVLTKASVILAASISVGVASPASAVDLSRITKDGLGAAIGAALGNQIGKGRGKQVATVVGAVLGAAVADTLQQQKHTAAIPQLPIGSQALLPQYREKLNELEVNFSVSREEFAGALLELRYADESLVLTPKSSDAMLEAERMRAKAVSAGRAYVSERTIFFNAVTYLANHGYDVRDYSYSYARVFDQVTANEASVKSHDQLRKIKGVGNRVEIAVEP